MSRTSFMCYEYYNPKPHFLFAYQNHFSCHGVCNFSQNAVQHDFTTGRKSQLHEDNNALDTSQKSFTIRSIFRDEATIRFQILIIASDVRQRCMKKATRMNTNKCNQKHKLISKTYNSRQL